MRWMTWRAIYGRPYRRLGRLNVGVLVLVEQVPHPGPYTTSIHYLPILTLRIPLPG